MFEGLRQRFRQWVPTIQAQRRWALGLFVAQGAITVTGAIVRVTGSGLGCETWPNCHEGSLVPVPGAAPALHQAIEFGNRLLTFVLTALAVITIIAMYKARRRQELKIYAWISLAGIALQAVIGGISVWLDLQWWAVALHFLPSMLLVWIAGLLYSKILLPDDLPEEETYPNSIRIMAAIAAAALAVVLTTGTMVTGSGPHPGDDGVGMDGRLNVDTTMMSYIHAASMYVYLALTIIVVYLLFRKHASQEARRIGLTLIGLVLIQWAIGVFQFYMGVPRWTVPIHIGMSSFVTAWTAVLWAHGRRRPGTTTAPVTGSPAGEEARTSVPA